MGGDDNSSEDVYNDTLQFFISPAAYFLNFPILPQFENTVQDPPILDCRYFDWEYFQNDYDCVDNLKQSLNLDFYKCYTMSLSDSQRKNVRGFSAVIYVEDFSENLEMMYQLDLIINDQHTDDRYAGIDTRNRYLAEYEARYSRGS